MTKKKVVKKVKKPITEMYLVANANEEDILREIAEELEFAFSFTVGDTVIGTGLTEDAALDAASENVTMAAEDEEEEEYNGLSLYTITITRIRGIGVSYERKVTLIDGEK